MASPQATVPGSGPLFVGDWTYRSFVNDPDPSVQPNELLFGLADIHLEEAPDGTLSGTLGGSGWSREVAGQASYGAGVATAKFQGTGTIGGEHWVYDYLGYFSPVWANASGQVPALVGTVVRTAQHGSAPAGFAAQFIAVSKA